MYPLSPPLFKSPAAAAQDEAKVEDPMISRFGPDYFIVDQLKKDSTVKQLKSSIEK